MTKETSLVSFIATIALLILLPASDLHGDDGSYRSAAEIDWQPASDMAASDLSDLPYFCRGRYREPHNDRDPANEKINATANEAVHVEGKSTTLIGDVVITLGSREIQSPRVIQNDLTQISEVDGPLQIRETGLLMTGEHATLNLFEGTGTIDQATFLLHQSRFRGQAATMAEDERGHILLDNATLTRCDPESNAWTARKVTFRVRDIPLLYVPYLRFPLNDERQSGFLLPNIGYDSDGGADLNIPYYLNLAPHYDATYQLRLLAKRGLVHDGQFRFLTDRSMNEINAAFMYKDDIYDDRIVRGQTAPPLDDPSILNRKFEKQDRWLLNVRHEGGSHSRWKTSINYSAISDPDYLHDIGGDVGSSTVEQYINPVDSNFSSRRTAALDQIGQIQYRGDSWNAELLLQGFQNLDPLERKQYERLPSLSADWFHRLGFLDLKLDLEYSVFDKDVSNMTGPLAITGDRAVADIDISWPMTNQWGFFKPAVGLIYRRYSLDDSPFERDNPEESTPRLSIDTGLYFDRYFDWNNTRIQQTLEPRAFYLYVEEDEQADLPQFDARPSTSGYSSIFRTNRFHGYDRLGDARQIGLGVTTRFLSESTGAEFFSTSIGQIYYLRDREVIFRPTRADDPTASRSALFTQARLTLSNRLRISGTYEWEPDINRSNRGTVAIKYRSKQRKIFNLNYIYTSPDIRTPNVFTSSEESDVNFIWPIANQWDLIGRWNFRWDDNRTIESFVGLEYNDCCWKSRLVVRRFLKEPRTIIAFVDDPNSPGQFIPQSEYTMPVDVGIFFEFQLKGLATLGKRLDSLLEDAIPGYRARENLIGQ